MEEQEEEQEEARRRVGSFTVLIKYLPQAGANTFLRGFDPVLLARVRYLIIPTKFGVRKILKMGFETRGGSD